MCGINGIVAFDAAPNRALMERMNSAIAHRGPDNDGIFQDGNTLLGHRRLSIIDLSDAGNQPFFSADRKHVIVYNGELYNYRDLRQELGEDQFTTQTDTEVVLAAFRKWGAGCLNHFNGMFAFAIWDVDQQKLFVARDRLGIKPLYWYLDDKQFVFSSEMRGLLASEVVPRKLNREALVDYLRYQTVHAPATIVQDVHMLRPGHFLELKEDELQQSRWWSLTQQVQVAPWKLKYEETCKQTSELLYKAVERRLVADVPFGAFLSGGIDSSAIVGIMSEVGNKQVNTFSVVFGEKEFSEAEYSQLISKRFNTAHTEIHLTANDFLETIPDALGAMDHPSGDGPNTFIVSKVTKAAGITMALSGLGGDEVFAGYDIFKRSVSLNQKKWLGSYPKQFRRTAAGALRLVKPSVSSDKLYDLLTLDYFDPEHTYPISRQVLLDRYVHQLLKGNKLPPSRLHEEVREQIEYGQPGFALPLLSKISVAEMSGYMQNVLLRDTDQMSMAHALEVRVPFLDHTLVEFALNVPDSQKYPHTPKKLLTDSLGSLIPDAVIHRKKMGFTLPWLHWMKNELRDYCADRLTIVGQLDMIDEKALMSLWQRFLKGDQRVTWSRLWPMVVLGEWIKTNRIEE